jgi:hypothetical protein
MAKLPLQPISVDEHGVLRFRENTVVRYLLDHGGLDMNHLAEEDFPQEDREQFAQLIGYSLGGFGELSYVREETYAAARVMAATPEGDEKDARIAYLEKTLQTIRNLFREGVAELYQKHPDDLHVVGDDEVTTT